MVTVFRIERKNGQGPYQSEIGLEISRRPYRPAPYEDQMDNWHGNSFGFKSLDQLLEWFDDTEELLMLKEANFKVFVYKLQEQTTLIEGKHQIAFNKQQAELLEEIPL